jgi:hypothetical protein
MSMTPPKTTLTRGQWAPALIGLPPRGIPHCRSEAAESFYCAIYGIGPLLR